MGSRGFDSGTNPNQVTIERVILTNTITAIRDEASKLRSEMEGIGSSGGVVSARLKQCFCCEEFTLPPFSEYEVCDLCGWIDDPYQNKHPSSHQGKNSLSLNEAREQYNNGHL